MGVDWFRMRPHRGVPRAQLDALIQAQASAFQALPQSRDVEPRAFYDETAAVQAEHLYLDRYIANSRALVSVLHIDREAGPDDFPASWRTYVLTHNRVFPPEWRLHAHRTYLPDELPRHVAAWRDYVRAIQGGDCRAYLFELYLYHFSLELYEGRSQLMEIAGTSEGEAPAWATKPALAELHEQIGQMEPPALHPAPVWPRWQFATSQPRDEGDELYALYRRNMDRLIKLTRAWDSSVRGSRKLRRYRSHYTPTFEQFLARAHDASLADFLAWVDRCCVEGMGLFLDY